MSQISLIVQEIARFLMDVSISLVSFSNYVKVLRNLGDGQGMHLLACCFGNAMGDMDDNLMVEDVSPWNTS